MEFKIVIEGNSGNCSISIAEKEFFKKQISKVLRNQGIDKFDIQIYN